MEITWHGEVKIEVESKKKQKYKTMENITYVLKNSIQIQKEIWIILLLYIVSSVVLDYSTSVISACIVNELENGADIRWIFNFVSAGFFACLLLYVIYIYTKGELDWRLYYIRTKFIEKLMRKVMTMNYETLEAPSTQDLKRKAFNTTSGSNYGIQGMIEASISNVLNAIKLLIAFVLILKKSLIILLCISVLTFIHFLIVDRTKQIEKKYTWDIIMPLQRKIEYLWNMTSDFMYGKDIRLFQMGTWLSKKMQRENEKAHRLIVKAQNRWIVSFGLNQIIDIVQNGLLYCWIVYSVLEGKMGISGLVLYLQVVQLFSGTLKSMLENIADTRRKSLEVDDYRAFVELEDSNDKQFSKFENSKREYNFTFENVSFRYSGQENYALKNINLTIRAGEKLAIVGLNGAGKTTLIKLLLKLYEPTEGRILVNGIDIKKIKEEEYYRKFAPMFQDSEIYAFSVEENISMRKVEDTQSVKVKEVAAMAGLTEKIEKLPNGFCSQLSKALYDDGIDLSGGERQKLALARALYKDADVIVLDEPTASLDALAESRLYTQFNSLVGVKTAIYISHRLASTKFCDKIAVFKEGSIEEYGTHEELMRQNGLYTELFHIQAKYYKESEAADNEEKKQ